MHRPQAGQGEALDRFRITATAPAQCAPLESCATRAHARSAATARVWSPRAGKLQRRPLHCAMQPGHSPRWQRHQRTQKHNRCVQVRRLRGDIAGGWARGSGAGRRRHYKVWTSAARIRLESIPRQAGASSADWFSRFNHKTGRQRIRVVLSATPAGDETGDQHRQRDVRPQRNPSEFGRCACP